MTEQGQQHVLEHGPNGECPDPELCIALLEREQRIEDRKAGRISWDRFIELGGFEL